MFFFVSLYQSITNSNGVAQYTFTGISSDVSVSASYSNASATCTIKTVSILFADMGVTGNYNTNYTNLNGTINANVSANGTNISCSTYADCYRKANTLLTGDFEITYNIVSKTNDSGGFAFLNTSNIRQWYIEFINNTKIDFLRQSNQKSYSNYTSDSIVKVTRIGSTVSMYLDDVLIASEGNTTTADGYFGWKTHSAGSRNFTFKDLQIKSL